MCFFACLLARLFFAFRFDFLLKFRVFAMVPFYLTIVNGKSYIWVEFCDGEDVREDGEQAFGEEATHYQLTDDSMRS